MIIPDGFIEEIQRQTELCDTYTSQLRDVIDRVGRAVHIFGKGPLAGVSAGKIKDLDSSLSEQIQTHFEHVQGIMSEVERYYSEDASDPEVTNLLQKIDELRRKNEGLELLLQEHPEKILEKAPKQERGVKRKSSEESLSVPKKRVSRRLIMQKIAPFGERLKEVCRQDSFYSNDARSLYQDLMQSQAFKSIEEDDLDPIEDKEIIEIISLKKKFEEEFEFREKVSRFIQNNDTWDRALMLDSDAVSSEELIEKKLGGEEELDQIMRSPCFLEEENKYRRELIEYCRKQIDFLKALKSKGEPFSDSTQLCRFLRLALRTESLRKNNYDEILQHHEAISEILTAIGDGGIPERVCYNIIKYALIGEDISFVKNNYFILNYPDRFITPDGIAFLKANLNDFSSFIDETILTIDEKFPQEKVVDFFFSHPEKFPLFCSITNTLKKHIDEKYSDSWRSYKSDILQEHALKMIRILAHPEGVVEELPVFYYYLTPEVRVELYKDVPSQLWPTKIWYDVEELHSDDLWEKQLPLLSSCALCYIPPEIILRFLAEKPEEYAIAWLRERFSFDGRQVSRISTLSEFQRDLIATRFRDFDQKCTSEKWLEALSLEKSEAERLCRERFDITRELSTESLQKLYKGSHPDDLLSVFSNLMKDLYEGRTLGLAVLLLFDCVLKEEICGGRRFITFKGASAASSLCCAQDGYPLRIRDSEGKVHTYFPRGMFNDPRMSVPAFTLCSLLSKEDPELHGLCRALMDNEPRGLLSSEALWAYNEIQRIAGYLRTTYPHLEESLKNENEISSWYGLLKSGCTNAARTIKDCSSENASHGHAVFLLSIIDILNHGRVEVSENRVKISFAENLSYCLSTVPLSDWNRPRVEDQPELTQAQLQECAADYFPYTLTAITPQRISPQIVAEAIDAVKELSSEQYEQLCAACMKIIQDEADLSSIPDDYLQEWEKYLPKELKHKESFLMFITEMRNKYYGATSEGIPIMLRPDTQYRFDATNIEQFGSPRPVPAFLVGEGNFANALCVHFTPVEPERHDGNCGVNSFLLGLNSENVYMDEESLEADIRKFRNDAVRFASDHRDTLAEKFSSEAVDRFIASFAKEPFTLWSSEITWECAAGMTGRPVKVYTMQGSDGTFATDEEGRVKPTALFMPSGEPVGPPIHLMYYGSVHYCLLQ